MYIPELWVGVFGTILVEFLLFIAYGIYMDFKEGDDNK